MPKRYRRLNMERMEAREMMAGDITATLAKGTLTLTEASGQNGRDNSVLVSQIAAGRVRIAGNPTTTDGTIGKVNGASYQDFNVSGDLVVKFGGGNDLVVFDQAAPPTFTNVNLDLSAPPVIAAPMPLGGGTSIPITPDKDNVIMWAANIKGNLTVTTGADDDYVYVANTPIGGNVSINTGAGADNVELQNMPGIIGGSVDIQLYSSLAETDADVAWLDHVSANGNINIRSGGGTDHLHLDSVTSYQDFNLDAGAGDDRVELNSICAVDDFFATLGDGNDNISVNDLYTIHGQTNIDGGNGSDSITKTGAFPTTQLTQIRFEYINGLPVFSTPIGMPVETHL